MLPPGVPGTKLSRLWRCSGDDTQRSYSSPGFRVSVHPEAGSQGADALWLSQPHHPEVAAAPPHTRKASQWRRASPPRPGGGREVSALSPISLIGNRGILGAWPIGIRLQHLFQLVQPKSGHLPLHLSPSEQVCWGGRDQRQEPLAWGAPWQESPVEEQWPSQY